MKPVYTGDVDVLDPAAQLKMNSLKIKVCGAHTALFLCLRHSFSVAIMRVSDKELHFRCRARMKGTISIAYFAPIICTEYLAVQLLRLQAILSRC